MLCKEFLEHVSPPFWLDLPKERAAELCRVGKTREFGRGRKYREPRRVHALNRYNPGRGTRLPAGPWSGTVPRVDLAHAEDMTRLHQPLGFAALIRDFFLNGLMSQQSVSPHTLAAYRDTFRLLLAFLQKRRRRAPTALTLDDIDAPTVLQFLNDLET